jgi:hypothetical protein
MKRTPLHLAILKEKQTSVEKLISRGANVNAVDEDDNTPIHIVSVTHVSLVSERIEKQSDYFSFLGNSCTGQSRHVCNTNND